MCNAWNHSPDCVCGWGGAGHLGRRGVEASSNDHSGFWWVPPITQTLESYVTPNAACPVCGASVFFYKSRRGGRVFFDELGPPWPKHPCTNNISIPKNLKAFSSAESLVSPSWTNAGWSPFFISEVLNIYKSVLEVKGTIEGKTMTLFVRKTPHVAINQITERSIAFLRRAANNFELSVLTRSQKPFTISAFSTLFEASGTAVTSFTKDALPNKTPGPDKNDSNAGISRKTAAASSSRVGTTQQIHKLYLEFARMTPAEQAQVKKENPGFHKSASRMAPIVLKVEANQQKRQSSPTIQLKKLFMEFAKMTPAEKEQVKKDDPVFHRIALRGSKLILKVEARRQKRRLSS